MRRLLVLASLASLLLAMTPGAAGAAAPTRTQEDSVFISCDVLTTDGFVSMYVAESSQYGAFGDLAFWPTGTEPFEGDPAYVTQDADIDADATAISATFDLVDFDPAQEPPFGDPAGTGVLDATLTPEGDPIQIDDRYRFGNRWEQVTGTFQPLSATGSLTLPGADLTDLTGCFAGVSSLSFWATNPSASNERFRQSSVSCQWMIGEEEEDGFVWLFMSADSFSAFGDVYVSSPGMDVGGFAEGTLTDSELALEVELQDFETGGAVGSATASATLESTGTRVRETFRDGRVRTKVVAELFSVDGELEVTLGTTTTAYPIDDEHCYAADERYHFHSVRPAGPKPGPLANDTPDGAIALKLGRTARIVTGGNALEPEAPCVVEGDGESFEIPLTYTAWWTVQGTGRDMTADTARSDFDTVLGVYTMGSGGLEQVVCVDDVFDPDFSLRAAATWSSVAGTTYYLQVGGFGGSAGRLELVVR